MKPRGAPSPIDMRDGDLCDLLQRDVLGQREVDAGLFREPGTIAISELVQIIAAGRGHDAENSLVARIPQLARDVRAEDVDLVAVGAPIVEILVEHHEVGGGAAHSEGHRKGLGGRG